MVTWSFGRQVNKSPLPEISCSIAVMSRRPSNLSPRPARKGRACTDLRPSPCAAQSLRLPANHTDVKHCGNSLLAAPLRPSYDNVLRVLRSEEMRACRRTFLGGV